MADLRRAYEAKRLEFSERLARISKRVKSFAWFRFVTFCFVFVPVSVFGWNEVAVLFSFIALGLFLFLVKQNIKLDRKKSKLKVMVSLVEDELLALRHSYLHFNNGKEFLNTDHFFSYDLDLFGDGSLFQFLNRTSTIGGRRRLAAFLISPSKKRAEIELRQEAVKELSKRTSWRLEFLANGNLFEETAQLNEELRSWSGMDLGLNYPGLVKVMTRIVPVVTLLALSLSILGFGSSFLVFMVFMQFLLMYFYWRRINLYFGFFGRKSGLLSKYMRLLDIVEQTTFESEYLLALQRKVKKPSSAKVFGKLKALVERFEYRQNILVGIALNALLLWDIRCVYNLWLWHQKFHLKIGQWLDVISELDALVSLGNYADNHRDFVFPEMHDGGFTYAAKELGHPLLEPEKRICNDFEINGWSKVVIVTGANMAGKSTFLRTVGVNMILAQLGAPVCAVSARFTPLAIYTNMRTTDSLLKDESYFFAELKRLKGVLERLQAGERIFVILDEMLKGTNSSDKLAGSRELIKRLAQFKSVSVIATHDLKLGEMEEEFPQQVFNKCFEIRIENDDLVFDYKLKNGVTRSMNATFLMKKMGII